MLVVPIATAGRATVIVQIIARTALTGDNARGHRHSDAEAENDSASHGPPFETNQNNLPGDSCKRLLGVKMKQDDEALYITLDDVTELIFYRG